MTVFLVKCVVCHEPLHLGAPVAFMDKQQLIHLSCYRPLSSSAATPRGAPRPSTRGRRPRGSAAASSEVGVP